MAPDPRRSAEAAATFLPESYAGLVDLFTRFDPSFGAVWAEHIERLLAREAIDQRRRFLVLTARIHRDRPTCTALRDDRRGLEADVDAGCR